VCTHLWALLSNSAYLIMSLCCWKRPWYVLHPAPTLDLTPLRMVMQRLPCKESGRKHLLLAHNDVFLPCLIISGTQCVEKCIYKTVHLLTTLPDP
jgi:hypothetical protein